MGAPIPNLQVSLAPFLAYQNPLTSTSSDSSETISSSIHGSPSALCLRRQQAQHLKPLGQGSDLTLDVGDLFYVLAVRFLLIGPFPSTSFIFLVVRFDQSILLLLCVALRAVDILRVDILLALRG